MRKKKYTPLSPGVRIGGQMRLELDGFKMVPVRRSQDLLAKLPTPLKCGRGRFPFHAFETLPVLRWKVLASGSEAGLQHVYVGKGGPRSSNFAYNKLQEVEKEGLFALDIWAITTLIKAGCAIPERLTDNRMNLLTSGAFKAPGESKHIDYHVVLVESMLGDKPRMSSLEEVKLGSYVFRQRPLQEGYPIVLRGPCNEIEDVVVLCAPRDVLLREIKEAHRSRSK